MAKPQKNSFSLKDNKLSNEFIRLCRKTSQHPDRVIERLIKKYIKGWKIKLYPA